MQELTDAEFVVLACADDTEAFRLLLERYQPMAFAIVLHQISQPETAQDLVQEALLQIYLSLDRLRNVDRFKSWLYGPGALSWLPLCVPIYLTFGSLIYPIVKAYYTNSAYGLNLTTPSLGIFIVLELVRGLLYVVALLPVLVATRGSRWQTLLYVFVFTGMFNAWQSIVNLTWPAQLRFAHTAEITGDVLVQSFLFCWLLTLKYKQQKRGETAGMLPD